MGGGLRRQDKASMAERISLYAGQGVGQITQIRPAADIVDRLAPGFLLLPAREAIEP